jgi:hypothetical protein
MVIGFEGFMEERQACGRDGMMGWICMGLKHGALRGRLNFTASLMGIKSVVGIFRLYYSFSGGW